MQRGTVPFEVAKATFTVKILLKVPRQNNMYSFDMKTPGLTEDYACLIAKATSDESKLCTGDTLSVLGKFDGKSDEGFLVGYSLNSKAYRVLQQSLTMQMHYAQKHIMEQYLKKTTLRSKLPQFNTGSGSDNTGSLMPSHISKESIGMVTDFNNLPTKVAVSPIPTLRIHNIHPQIQILGNPKSSVQTRSRVKQTSRAHALEEPKKISKALKDDSWVKAMQEELLQFRLQQNQMLDYGFNFMNTKIHIDNESTICIVKNSVYHSKTKHVEIRHHFIQDSYEKKLIRVEKIHTDLNVADLLTKAFDGPRDCQWYSRLFKKASQSVALTHNPTIHDSPVKQFWHTATASTLADGTLKLRATIDTHEYTITEASVRSQADQAGTQSQPSSFTVPPPPTSQPATTTIPPTPITEQTSKPSSPPTAPENETMEHHFEQPSPEHQQSSPRQASDIPQYSYS
ncbi:hypothetical protein Tco_1464876 [Tanacetum coccineum]